MMICFLTKVSLLPEMDQWNETKAQLLAQMDICMGGRIGEELIFGTDHVTTGASSDFEQATKIARFMITKCGMSEKVGWWFWHHTVIVIASLFDV